MLVSLDKSRGAPLWNGWGMGNPFPPEEWKLMAPGCQPCQAAVLGSWQPERAADRPASPKLNQGISCQETGTAGRESSSTPPPHTQAIAYQAEAAMTCKPSLTDTTAHHIQAITYQAEAVS